jgi:L-lactate dehydrogenase complex protein LldG
MNTREAIMGRIREALRRPAPLPGHGGTAAAAHSGDPSGPIAKWLPPVGDSFEERVVLFRTNAAALKAEFYLLPDQAALRKLLIKLREREHWTKAGVHTGKLIDIATECLQLPVCRTDQEYAVKELESCSVGITECDALVAQTGSVLLTSRSAGGRALSVLPPHHVVLARREQLVADLPSAFGLLKTKYAASYPSFTTFITGPSRTGDIERILVLGAHGPKKLTIICV